LLALIAESPDEAPFALEALAQGYMQSFRWADAITTLDRLLDVWPQRADLYVWRGWVQEKLLRIDHATKDYRKAVELSPNTDEARLRLGEALVATSNFEEAADHLEQVRQRRPDDSAVLLGLSRCRTELLQLDEAGQLLDRLLALKPRAAAALTQRGKWEMKRGRLDKAEDWLRQSLALAPAERETNYQLALCLRQRGKAAEADACLARLKQIERDQDRLAELYGEMVKKPRDLALRREAGVILLNNGQADEGIRVLQSVLDEDAGNGPAHAALADYYQRTGNRALAERHRRRAQ
jgi:tetratricopeptide (TPR) repeat protein